MATGLINIRASDRPNFATVGSFAETNQGSKISIQSVTITKNIDLVKGKEEILVRVIPDRGELARRLLGARRRFSPERNAVAELVAERAAEG